MAKNYRYKDITGKKFSRWTALSTNYEKNKHGYCLWLCICECGTLREIPTNNLKSGNSMSCGCLTRDKAKLGLSRKGKKGQKMSASHRKAVSESMKKWVRTADYGAKISASKKGKPVPKLQGANHPYWNPDRSHGREKRRIRGSMEWKQWRESVFARDNFTCKECGVIGTYIEPHHIIPFRSGTERLFDTNNGITLCRPCHQKTFRKEELFADRYFAMVSHSN